MARVKYKMADYEYEQAAMRESVRARGLSEHENALNTADHAFRPRSQDNRDKEARLLHNGVCVDHFQTPRECCRQCGFDWTIGRGTCAYCGATGHERV